jgi:hypothetical protein
MARKTKAQKQHEAYVEKLIGRALVGNPVSVLDLGKIFVKAESLVAELRGEEEIAESLKAFVKSLAVKVA